MSEYLNDPKIKWARIANFAGGINERDDPYVINDNQLVTAKNIVFRGGPTAKVRMGQSPYIDKDYHILSAACRGGYRYTATGGTKKVIVNSGGTIYSDGDNGQFDSVQALTPGGEGFVHFLQHKDTVLITSKGDDTLYYHPGDPTDETYQPNMAPLEWDFSTTVVATAGGYIPDGYTRYRITFDIKHDDDFLGETGAAGDLEATAVQYDYYDADCSGGTGNVNMVTFKRPADAIINAIPTYVSQINFYRSSPQASAVTPAYPYTEDTELFFVGSAAMATVRAATAGDTIFVDYGKIPLGRQIEYGVKFYPPRARYCAALKGRLYLLNCSSKENFGAAYVDQPHNLWWTRFSSRAGTSGMAPLSFGTSNSTEIEAIDGEGGMGITVYKGKSLLILKPNRTVLLTVSDDNIDEDIPDFSPEIIDENIGCIAPETLQVIRGIPVWVSHIGPVYFDGTKVLPLGNDLIQKSFLSEIPCGRRRYMVGAYDSLNNEYQIFHSNADHPDYNKAVMVYNFNTGAWSRWELIYGVGTVIEVKDSDCDSKILWGFDDLADNFDAFQDDYLIVQAESSYTEGDRAETAIPWSIETGFHHFGTPQHDKEFIALWLEINMVSNPQLDIKIDNRVDTAEAGTTMGMFSPAVIESPNIYGPWGISRKKLGMSGRRLAVKISGIMQGTQDDLFSIMVAFKDKGVTDR